MPDYQLKVPVHARGTAAECNEQLHDATHAQRFADERDATPIRARDAIVAELSRVCSFLFSRSDQVGHGHTYDVEVTQVLTNGAGSSKIALSIAHWPIHPAEPVEAEEPVETAEEEGDVSR